MELLVAISHAIYGVNTWMTKSFSETEKGIFDAILEGEIDFKSEPWPSISNSAKDLIRKMLTQDPKKRITAAQVLGEYKFVGSMHAHTLLVRSLEFG